MELVLSDLSENKFWATLVVPNNLKLLIPSHKYKIEVKNVLTHV